MKQNQNPESDERLRAVLREWVVDTPLPPRFQDQVWKRIARDEVPSASSFWAWLVRLVEVVLLRPRIAFSYVAALLVLGVAAGSVAAQIKSNRLDATLSTRYVQSVDPYRADSSQP
jgi:predicted membrane-bound dolichyl-phosphate-mannose-protein mannosyltransferase